MSVIDLDEYPEGTEEVLIVLWKYEQARKNKEMENHWIKRRQIAGRTSLDKQKVRYRLDQLVEDNYVTEDIVTEHNQPVNYYALPPDGKESAKAIIEAKDVLGEIPKEVDRQDVLRLTNEMAALRAEIESYGLELENVSESKYIEKLESVKKFTRENKNNIQKIKNWQLKDEERIEKIENELGIEHSKD